MSTSPGSSMSSAMSQAGRLDDGATVAIVGGGPAGSFFALHLLRRARVLRRGLRVAIFERRCPPPRGEEGMSFGPYKDCPRCAGGVSPRLSDALSALGIGLPDSVLQTRVRSITVQGNWKPIYLQVPRGRTMVSVYRGVLPRGHGPHHEAFDELLLEAAARQGAQRIGCRVHGVFYDDERHPVVAFESADGESRLRADFVAFAGGVNERSDPAAGRRSSAELLRMLQPAFQPPPLRKALIAELAAPVDSPELEDGQLHYLESSAEGLRLDMCSIMPKRGYFTLSLIGRSVDDATTHKDNLEIIHRFIATPRVRRVLPLDADLRVRCICNPHIVVGTAKKPCADRAAAVGDLATSRQYKDGILAAHDMARDLAEVVLEQGTSESSLEAGYGPTLGRFRRDNRFASVIFLLYRWFFTSSSLSRIIYQTAATERKTRRASGRSFERIFWTISSGDENYEQIAWAMLKPSTLWKILAGGVYITFRNWLTELFFGLDWRDIGRFPTAVPVESLREHRSRLLDGRKREFECIYTIHVRASPEDARRLLAKFGEPSRPYLHPRWVSIRRERGDPLQDGCRIRYRVFGGLLSFAVVQQGPYQDGVVRNRVLGGFADGGAFVFLVEPEGEDRCAVTVYLAFDYVRGAGPGERLFWRSFRALFPEFIHDVLWNHALCELKQAAEARRLEH